jgi:hypothetical protein
LFQLHWSAPQPKNDTTLHQKLLSHILLFDIGNTEHIFNPIPKNELNKRKENEMEYSHLNPEGVFNTLGPPIAIIIVFFVLAVTAAILIIKAVIFCRIFYKAGYHWALGLLMLVPIACIIMPFVLAFGQWPIYRELQQLRRQQNKVSP